MQRRDFIQQSGGLFATSMLANNAFGKETFASKKRIAMVHRRAWSGYVGQTCIGRIWRYGGVRWPVRYYANKVQVSYLLTAFSPYEGYRIAFNGTKGRLEAWIKETQPWEEEPFDEFQLTHSFGKREIIKISNKEAGHSGGDSRLCQQIFNPDGNNPYRQAAGSRDGAMACLIGIAARNSIDSGKPVIIADLTSLKPETERPLA